MKGINVVYRLLFFICIDLTEVGGFAVAPLFAIRRSSISVPSVATTSSSSTQCFASQQSVSLKLDPDGLKESQIRDLFAWVRLAFAGNVRYNNLVLAFCAIFGQDDLPEESVPMELLQAAREAYAATSMEEDTPVGERLSAYERQQASLGAMGAAQWMGHWKTRPHALLRVHNYTTVQDWEQSLPRGCRRTLKRALQQNFTVTARPIGEVAPHSSLAHFRCVVEHEVRLLVGTVDTDCPEDVLEALSVAISRYIGTTQMAGQIQEYRDGTTGRIIGFAHEVQKGRTIRGQWFYVTDQAAKQYVWFHSVRSLVARAIESKEVDVVDLGPSGSDSFSELKARYGFVSVDDWPAVADYNGPFWDDANNRPVGKTGWLF